MNKLQFKRRWSFTQERPMAHYYKEKNIITINAIKKDDIKDP